MAPTPTETSGRFWLDYNTGRVQHNMLVRYDQFQSSPVDVSNALGLILVILRNNLPDTWRVTGARYAPSGQVFSTDYDLSNDALAGFVGNNGEGIAERDEPRQVTWVGRSITSGVRSRLSIFGLTFTTPPRYRFGFAEFVASSPGIISQLNVGAQNGRFICVDNSRPTWRGYVNVNYNSHWEEEARR